MQLPAPTARATARASPSGAACSYGKAAQWRLPAMSQPVVSVADACAHSPGAQGTGLWGEQHQCAVLHKVLLSCCLGNRGWKGVGGGKAREYPCASHAALVLVREKNALRTPAFQCPCVFITATIFADQNNSMSLRPVQHLLPRPAQRAPFLALVSGSDVLCTWPGLGWVVASCRKEQGRRLQQLRVTIAAVHLFPPASAARAGHLLSN